MAAGPTGSCRSRLRRRLRLVPVPALTGDRAIEIRLPNGIVIGVSDAVAVEPLRRVLAVLAGR